MHRARPSREDQTGEERHARRHRWPPTAVCRVFLANARPHTTWPERIPPKPKVIGSSPIGRTNHSNNLQSQPSASGRAWYRCGTGPEGLVSTARARCTMARLKGWPIAPISRGGALAQTAHEVGRLERPGPSSVAGLDRSLPVELDPVTRLGKASLSWFWPPRSQAAVVARAPGQPEAPGSVHWGTYGASALGRRRASSR